MLSRSEFDDYMIRYDAAIGSLVDRESHLENVYETLEHSL